MFVLVKRERSAERVRSKWACPSLFSRVPKQIAITITPLQASSIRTLLISPPSFDPFIRSCFTAQCSSKDFPAHGQTATLTTTTTEVPATTVTEPTKTGETTRTVTAKAVTTLTVLHQRTNLRVHHSTAKTQTRCTQRAHRIEATPTAQDTVTVLDLLP